MKLFRFRRRFKALIFGCRLSLSKVVCCSRVGDLCVGWSRGDGLGIQEAVGGGKDTVDDPTDLVIISRSCFWPASLNSLYFYSLLFLYFGTVLRVSMCTYFTFTAVLPYFP